MSGKYRNKKNRKNQWWKIVLLFVCLVAVCAEVAWVVTHQETVPEVHTPTDAPVAETDEPVVPDTPAESKPVQVDDVKEVSINLGKGMRIIDVGKYTGIYMEDGTDEIVSGVMMIVVTNEGEDDIQYAEITMPVGDKTAEFSLSTLPAGSTVVLLEQSRMPYEAGEYTTAVAENVALFSEPLSLCEDKLKIQILDGAINVTNISGADITGDIFIYYKNSAADVYYGGITYRVRLEGGMMAEETKQIMASHFSESGSAIMFVTCPEN